MSNTTLSEKRLIPGIRRSDSSRDEAGSDDLSQICDYTEKRFGLQQARRTAMAIYDAAGSLKEMPLRGREGRKPATRELIVAGLPFLIIYRERNEVVEILRVLHGSQQWP